MISRKNIAFITNNLFFTNSHGIRTLTYSLIHKTRKLGLAVHVVNVELKNKETILTELDVTDKDLFNRGFESNTCIGKSKGEILHILKSGKLASFLKKNKMAKVPSGKTLDPKTRFDTTIMSYPFWSYPGFQNPWLNPENTLPNSNKFYLMAYDTIPNRVYLAKPDDAVVHRIAYEQQLAYKFADDRDGILCITDDAKKQCQIFGFGKKRGLKVLPLMLPPGYERIDIPLNRDRSVILSAPFNKRKGLSIMPDLLNAGSLDRITIFGQPIEDIQHIIDFFTKLDTDNVTWWINVDYETQKKLYLNSRVLLFPSISEGLGIPLLEAYACGCSALVSDISPLNKIAFREDILPGDLEAACKILRKHLSKKHDPKFYQKLVHEQTSSFNLSI